MLSSREKKAKFAQKNRDTILPAKTALIINDIIAVSLFAVGFIFVLMLITYHPTDNCWFRSTDTNVIANQLGVIGAYLSDFILSIFGLSGWWFVVGLFYLGYRKIIRNKIESGDWYTIFQVICFILLIISSTVFEYVNFDYYFGSGSYLHNGPGGLFGKFMYGIMAAYVGRLGASITTIVCTVIFFSFAFSISLGYIAEKIGWIIDLIYILLVKIFSRSSTDNTVDVVDNLNDDEPSSVGKFKPRGGIAFAAADNLPAETQTGFDELFANLDDEGKLVDSQGEQATQSPFTRPKFKASRLNKVDMVEEEPDLSTADLPDDDKAVTLVTTTVSHRVNSHASGAVLLPSTDLLDTPKKQTESITDETIEYVSKTIENKLLEFNVEATVVGALSGPVVTRYELLPSRGVRGEKVVGLGKEIARGLALSDVRIVETIPGKNTMGIEVPNYKRQTIYLKDVFDSVVFANSTSKLTLALGKDIAGTVVVADLGKMPHLLVAGTTGSGKSVAINSMILSLLFQATADEVKFIMIDPKMVELSFYQDIPHLLAPIITDFNYAVNALKWVVGEMERRYRIMAKVGCKNISGFNQKIDETTNNGETLANPISLTPENPESLDKWPYIVVIVDELADLMMSSGKKVEQYIARIAQKARAVGIHLILATQRPSVDVITGLIKANVPTRISFHVASKIDSRTILDQGGAETLLGQGDMLYISNSAGLPQRIHGAFVNDNEINRVVEFLKQQQQPEYIEEILSGEVVGIELPGLDDGSNDNPEKDGIFDEAVKFICETKRCSISSLQTRFGIGYNRAARIMAHLENIGMVRRNERGGFELVRLDG